MTEISSISTENEAILDRHLNLPGFFANPYPIYGRLQTQDPVHWSDHWQAWVITRYDDVMTILRNPAHFLNAGRQERLLAQLPREARDELQPLAQHYAQGGLINSDPPLHTRLRGLVNKAFTTRAVERLRSQIQAIVNQQIDTIQSAGQMDVIRDLAYPLPAIVIAEMLGVPAGDREQFKQWSEMINTFLGAGRPGVEVADRAQQSLLQMKSYLGSLLAERRRQPQDDLLSGLALAEEAGEMLSEEELLATCVTLLIAGHETTTNLIGNGLLALLHHPDQLRKLRDNPDLVTGAVEELLRYDGPVHSLKRIAADDIEFNGQRLKRGQLLYAMLGAANRDPTQFTEPERLNIMRPRRENRHIAFGYGIHFCVGAPLARLEAPIALNTMLSRLPDLRLSTTLPVWQKNMAVRGVKSLPIAFG